MSVGSVRQRGQEGSPVLFPQRGSRCITVVCQTQVCLDRVLDPTEKKKELQQQTARSHIVCLSICKHVDYRGLFCGFDFVTFFFCLSLSFLLKHLVVPFWQANQESGLC